MRKLAPTCLMLLMLLALMLGITQPAYADGPLTPPCQLWGTVTVNGSPAAAGVPVVAKVGNTQIASATTDTQGRYGYSSAFMVPGTNGTTVEFYVNGVKCAQSTTFASGAMTSLNLSVGGPPTPPAPTTPEPTTPALTSPATSRTINTSILGQSGSFTINASGVLGSATTLSSPDGKVQLSFNANTAINIQGQSLTITKETSPPSLPADTSLIAAYNFSPDNATFEPPLTLTLKYDLAALPTGVAESGLFIAYWDGSKWSAVSSNVDTQTKIMMVQISHFSTFAILGMAGNRAAPAPASFTVSDLKVSPTSVKPGEQVTITVTVANNGGTEGSYNAVLKINDVDEAQKQVTLGPKGKQEITFTTSQETIGNYSVAIAGESSSFKVSAPGQAARSNWSWLLIGGIAAGILLIVFIIIVLLRRRAYNY